MNNDNFKNIKSELTIIIPVYNESANLDRLELSLKNYFSKSRTKNRVILIDDGSTDNSYEKIINMCSRNHEFDFIKFDRNYGLSSAIKAGIDHCFTDLIGYIDADLQTTPFDFDKLLRYIDEYDAVIGFRGKRRDTVSKKIQSFIANNIRRFLINDSITDTGCPLKIIKTDVAKKILFFDGMHRFIPALIQLQGGKIKQIEVRHFERVAGKSKFNVFNRSIRPLIDTFAYRWMRSRYLNYKIERSSIK